MKKDTLLMGFPRAGIGVGRIGRMCVWPIGINQIRVEHRRRRISLYVAVPEQGCTSCERGRVVMGRLKRMIVTVSSSSRLLVSARVCPCPRDGLPCLRSNNPVFRFSFWTASYQRFCVCKNKYKSQVSAHQRLWSRERLSNAH